jgi:uncharacterized membrane protein
MAGKTVLAILTALLAASAFVLALKLIQSASITIEIGPTGNTTISSSIPGLFDFTDVLTVLISALVAGASATAILMSRGQNQIQAPQLAETILNDRKAKWQEISKSLKADEMTVYQAILNAGGLVNQGDLVSNVGLSKATVSRTLDLLESKGLVERRRRGMGNVILLK